MWLYSSRSHTANTGQGPLEWPIHEDWLYKWHQKKITFQVCKKASSNVLPLQFSKSTAEDLFRPLICCSIQILGWGLATGNTSALPLFKPFHSAANVSYPCHTAPARLLRWLAAHVSSLSLHSEWLPPVPVKSDRACHEVSLGLTGGWQHMPGRERNI